MKTFELTPVNNRKSFYGKCKVSQEGKNFTLLSYDTKVATFKNGVLWITKEPKHLSKTTLTHINAFLVNVCNKKTMSKKEILNFE